DARLGQHSLPVAMPLVQGIEDEVVGKAEQLGHLGGLVGGGKDVDLPTEFLVPEPGLVQATGGRAREVGAQQGIERETGEGLLRQEDAGAGCLLDATEDFPIVVEAPLVEHVAGGVDSAALKGGEEGGGIA